MPKTALSSSQKLTDSGLEASMRTYRRCAKLVALAVGVEAVMDTSSGKRSFEQTLERVTKRIEAESQQSSEDTSENLDEEDFSINAVIGIMCETALSCRAKDNVELSRPDFIKKVNLKLHERGLGQKLNLQPKAKTGRYAWIDDHIARFTRRNPNLIKLKGPAQVIILTLN